MEHSRHTETYHMPLIDVDHFEKVLNIKALLRNIFSIITIFSLFVPSSASAQPIVETDRSISVEGIYLRPLGIFGQEWKTGKGLYASVVLPLDHQVQFPVRTGFITLKHDQSRRNDAAFTIVPIHVGIRYQFLKSRLTPFAEVMNGLNLIHETVDLTGRDNERSVIRYFFQIGTGLSVPLSDLYGLTIGARYNSSFYENDKVQYGETGAMMTAFEYSIGFIWVLR